MWGFVHFDSTVRSWSEPRRRPRLKQRLHGHSAAPTLLNLHGQCPISHDTCPSCERGAADFRQNVGAARWPPPPAATNTRPLCGIFLEYRHLVNCRAASSSWCESRCFIARYSTSSAGNAIALSREHAKTDRGDRLPAVLGRCCSRGLWSPLCLARLLATGLSRRRSLSADLGLKKRPANFTLDAALAWHRSKMGPNEAAGCLGVLTAPGGPALGWARAGGLAGPAVSQAAAGAGRCCCESFDPVDGPWPQLRTIGGHSRTCGGLSPPVSGRRSAPGIHSAAAARRAAAVAAVARRCGRGMQRWHAEPAAELWRWRFEPRAACA